MNLRVNANYIITDSIHIGNKEFVLGVHNTAPSQFVTWECTGGNDYNFGHYYSDMLSATKDLLERANQELKYCMSRKDKAQERPATVTKEQEDICL